MQRFFSWPTSFDVLCGGAHHSIKIGTDGRVYLEDHEDIDMLRAFSAFGAKRPECLVYYDWLADIYIRVTAHTYSFAHRRPFEPYVPGTPDYESMMKQPYAQAMGHPPADTPELHVSTFGLTTALNVLSERRFAEAYRAISATVQGAAKTAMLIAIPALNVYKMPAGQWGEMVEFQGHFRFEPGAATIRGRGKGSDPDMMRGDVARFILLQTSFSEYAEVLDKLDGGQGPAGTFALNNKGDRAAIAAIVEWLHRGHIEVVAGRPMRGFTVKSRRAIIGWDARRDDWVLKRWK
jgi:hypothetical protein